MISKQNGIKKIQRGVITIAAGATSATATISQIDTSKSIIDFLGSEAGGAGNTDYYKMRLSLTNSTTLSASIGYWSSDAVALTYQVTEYW